MLIEVTQEELVLLQIGVASARFEFEKVARESMGMEGWRETQYLPKVRLFDQLQAKLNTLASTITTTER
jgi:hypothetical protein